MRTIRMYGFWSLNTNLDGKQGYLVNLKCLFVWKYTQYIFFSHHWGFWTSQSSWTPTSRKENGRRLMVSGVESSHFKMVPKILGDNLAQDFFPETLSTSNSAILLSIHTYIHTYVHTCIVAYICTDKKIQRYKGTWINCCKIFSATTGSSVY